MTVWRSPVSWSKFKLALECPRQLKYNIDRVPFSETQPNYYLSLGILVQYVFELYFNQGINLRPGGDKPEIAMKILDRVLASSWFKSQNLTFPLGKGHDDFISSAKAQVLRGFQIMQEVGLLKRKVNSEAEWRATFHNFRMYGKMDFVVETQRGYYLYDGKGNARTDADERQILYYAIILTASGKNVLGGGLLYWQHDYKPVDVRPSALKAFIDGDFARGREVFERLARGTEDMEAKPSSSTCRYCSWKSICPASAYQKKVQEVEPTQEVGFEKL